MIINLVGRLEDGSDRTPGLPASPATPVKVINRVDVVIRLRVLTPQAVPVKAADFTSMRLTVRQQVLGAPAILKITGVSNVQNASWDFTITAAQLDAAKIPPGMYAYDVWAVKDDLREVVMPLSAFHVTPTMGASA